MKNKSQQRGDSGLHFPLQVWVLSVSSWCMLRCTMFFLVGGKSLSSANIIPVSRCPEEEHIKRTFVVPSLSESVSGALGMFPGVRKDHGRLVHWDDQIKTIFCFLLVFGSQGLFKGRECPCPRRSFMPYSQGQCLRWSYCQIWEPLWLVGWFRVCPCVQLV